MFIRSESKNKGLQSVKLDIGTFFDQEKAEDVQITLREVSIAQSMELTKDTSSKAVLNMFMELLPDILIEHNLYETPGELMTTENVIDLFKKKGKLLSYIMQEYTRALFQNPPKQSAEK